MERSLLDCATAEIVERHEFFVRWYTDPSPDGAEFARSETAFDAEFVMVTPDGDAHGHAQVIEFLRGARGSADAGFRIAIEAVEPLWQGEDAILVGYVEAQQRDGLSTRRRSSALFVRSEAAPQGVAWRHLQETWLDMKT
ncbi:hypothetical protein SAMN05444161_7328 [Rhizobiales bacterium GAS191]|jgi:hypothetical protein|nr:hypothetical protein SAMN05519103_06679 [Rhizobiales bacterium GAS113]SEE82628.1 hypothetical protein SAMN05444161_7328 [Rhizobiales bacterium GAS191]